MPFFQAMNFTSIFCFIDNKIMTKIPTKNPLNLFTYQQCLVNPLKTPKEYVNVFFHPLYSINEIENPELYNSTKRSS